MTLSPTISPAAWLALTSAAEGPRAALTALLDTTLPDGLDEPLAALIVAHLAHAPLSLRWDLMSFWRPRPRPASLQLVRVPSRDPRPRPSPALRPLRPGLMAARDAFVALAGEPLTSAYRRYFLTGGVLDDVLPDAFEQDWVDDVVPALTRLERFWQAAESGEDYVVELQAATRYFACDAASTRFSTTYFDPAGDADGVTRAEARTIWARRLAVSLWADRHGHWPWRLDSLLPSERRALLAWEPEAVTELSEKPSWSRASRTYDSATMPTNGQGLYVWPDGSYGTGQLWTPDPFLEWRLAYLEVAAPGLVARRDAPLAVTAWVRQRGLLHDAGDVSRPYHSPNAHASLPEVLARGFAGCTSNTPLCVALCRALGVPAFEVITGVYKRDLARAVIETGAVELGHHTVVCPSHDVGLALLHGDDLLAFRGHRFAPPAGAWLPIGEWLLVHLIGAGLRDAALGPVLSERAYTDALAGLDGLAQRGAATVVADLASGSPWGARVVAVLDGSFDKLVWSPADIATLGPASWLDDLVSLTGGDPGESPAAWREAARAALMTAVFGGAEGPAWGTCTRAAKSFLARASHLVEIAYAPLAQEWRGQAGLLSEDPSAVLWILLFGVELRTTLSSS